MVAPLWVCQSLSCNQRPWRTVHGLYKSYTGLEARVESRSANHRPSRLGHVGAYDGLWLDGDWAFDTFFLSRTDRNMTTWVTPRSVWEARLKIDQTKHMTESEWNIKCDVTTKLWFYYSWQTCCGLPSERLISCSAIPYLCSLDEFLNSSWFVNCCCIAVV